jgi:phospholipase/lecithinase/hemolysin
MEGIKRVMKSLLVLILIGIFHCGYAVTVDKIVAFGDSLSDNGNIFTFTKRAHNVLPFVPIIPMDPPYYKGRFTNGENWLDLLAEQTRLPLLVHAYGGAWAEPMWDSAQLVPFDINDQVGLYIIENALDRHKDRHLFIVWAGANDYLDGREDVEYATTNVVKNIQQQIERLIYHGAHQLMILSLPDVSKTPEVIEKGPVVVAQTQALIEAHNKKLAAMIKAEQEKNPKVIIVFTDIKAPFDELITNPEKFQLKNVSQACYGGSFYLNRKLIDNREILAAKEVDLDIMNNASLRVAYMTSKLAARGNNVCANPDEHLFWDHLHPTSVIHRVIATLA